MNEGHEEVEAFVDDSHWPHNDLIMDYVDGAGSGDGDDGFGGQYDIWWWWWWWRTVLL